MDIRANIESIFEKEGKQYDELFDVRIDQPNLGDLLLVSRNHAAMSNWVDSRDAALTAIALDEECEEAYVLAGRAQYALGKVWSAKLDVCRGLARFPINKELNDLSDILYQRKGSEAHASMFLGRVPSDIRSHNTTERLNPFLRLRRRDESMTLGHCPPPIDR